MCIGLSEPSSYGLDVHGKENKEAKEIKTSDLFKIFGIGSQNVITTQVMALGMWKITEINLSEVICGSC